MARIAKSLETLRTQIDTRHPNRSKVSDGWIGDPAHAARKSDHNPNSRGVVQALDLTHDIDQKGDDFDAWAFAETLRQNKDRRVKYVISNGRIFYSHGEQPWQWQKYTGKNAHTQHTHISVNDDPSHYDDPAPWKLAATGPLAPKPDAPKTPVTAAIRDRMADKIIDYEARWDKGNIAVFTPTDGSQEIAGINNRPHPAEFAKIKALVDAGKHAEARAAMRKFILQYTEPVTSWHTNGGVEFFLRDCAFNRGKIGAATILQLALGFRGAHVDGQIGQQSRAAIAEIAPLDLLTKLRAAREQYELDTFGKRTALWPGLVNRWNKAHTDAVKFYNETKSVTPAGGAATGTVVVGSGAGAAVAVSKGVDIWTVLPFLILGLSVGLLVWKFWPRKES